jgi:hypothetical protein
MKLLQILSLAAKEIHEHLAAKHLPESHRENGAAFLWYEGLPPIRGVQATLPIC